ncbi:Uncharacterised protein [Actinobaculum suis]|uniref:Uncharacterized protein n=1 Tax=Actinobaculum suis TaxID=1657 RepID=A0A7Z8Y8P2_9ACTO|nr:hypothetical protein [Actinobaculum suis]VDG75745.1 Uncharacterised protein [Actinobaculum suis]
MENAQQRTHSKKAVGVVIAVICVALCAAVVYGLMRSARSTAEPPASVSREAAVAKMRECTDAYANTKTYTLESGRTLVAPVTFLDPEDVATCWRENNPEEVAFLEKQDCFPAQVTERNWDNAWACAMEWDANLPGTTWYLSKVKNSFGVMPDSVAEAIKAYKKTPNAKTLQEIAELVPSTSSNQETLAAEAAAHGVTLEVAP